MAASAVALLVHAVSHRQWGPLAFLLLPLYCVFRAVHDATLSDQVSEHREAVIESLEEGVCVVEHERPRDDVERGARKHAELSTRAGDRPLLRWRRADACGYLGRQRRRRGHRRRQRFRRAAIDAAGRRRCGGSAGQDRPESSKRDAHLARRHRPRADGQRPRAERSTFRAPGVEHQRRLVGVGSCKGRSFASRRSGRTSSACRRPAPPVLQTNGSTASTRRIAICSSQPSMRMWPATATNSSISIESGMKTEPTGTCSAVASSCTPSARRPVRLGGSHHRRHRADRGRAVAARQRLTGSVDGSRVTGRCSWRYSGTASTR